MAPDPIYSLTRRLGKRATVSLHKSTAVNPVTLVREEDRQSFELRRVVKQPTSYTRHVSARAAQTDIGETTFIFWGPDISFNRLTPEDYIVMDGERYDFVESTAEGRGLLATANRIVGQNKVAGSITQNLGLDGSANAVEG